MPFACWLIGWKVLAGHAVHCRSDVGVPAVLRYSPALQNSCLIQLLALWLVAAW